MKHDLLIQSVQLVLVIAIVACFCLVWYYFYRFKAVSVYGWKGNVTITAVYLVIYLYFSKIYDSMQISTARVGEIIYNQALAIAISDGVIYVIICLLAKRLPNLIPGHTCFFLQVWIAGLWGLGANKLYYKVFRPARRSSSMTPEKAWTD